MLLPNLPELNEKQLDALHIGFKNFIEMQCSKFGISTDEALNTLAVLTVQDCLLNGVPAKAMIGMIEHIELLHYTLRGIRSRDKDQ